MKRQLYHIEPIYKSFIWGGRALIDHFHIKTDMENIGTIYHVIAIPGQLDNTCLLYTSPSPRDCS